MYKRTNLVGGSHSVYDCIYHLEWCPKYRFTALRKESSKADMETILKQVASEHEMIIEELA
ncbi:MAG: transposase [Candidatus ainarchaeum sp.]|nr:transposase [Candidatus ainarchaeum sp.]